MGLPEGYRLETVRGRVDDPLAQQLLDFWTSHGVLTAEAGRERLRQVVCVLYDDTGRLAGVNSVTDEVVPMLGNRRLWRYRMFVPDIGTRPGLAEVMIGSAKKALEEEFRGEPDEPQGLCVLVTGKDIMRQMPEAVWPATGLIYAGYTNEGHQLRVGWFEGGRI